MVAITWHISEDLHVRGREARPIKEPWWKRRIEQDIKEARKVISKLERKKKNEIRRYDREMAYLERRNKVNEKGITTVVEELKQRVTAKATKITRYENRTKQFKQNRLFEEIES